MQLAMHMVNPLGKVPSALCELHQLRFMGPWMSLLSPAPRLGSRANDGGCLLAPPHEHLHAVTVKNNCLRRRHHQNLLLPLHWIQSAAQTDSEPFRSTQCKTKRSVDLLSGCESIHDIAGKLLLDQPQFHRP